MKTGVKAAPEKALWALVSPGWLVKNRMQRVNTNKLKRENGGFVTRVWFWSCPLKGKINTDECKVIQTDHLSPIRKHFHPYGSILLQDNYSHIHSYIKFIVWFKEYRNCVNYML